MGFKRIKKWVTIKIIMAFDSDLKDTVTSWSRNAHNHVSIINLSIVQGNLSSLVNGSRNQLRRTGNTASILATKGQIKALLTQLIKQWLLTLHLKSDVVAVGNRHNYHSQISLVQSPPG